MCEGGGVLWGTVIRSISTNEWKAVKRQAWESMKQLHSQLHYSLFITSFPLTRRAPLGHLQGCCACVKRALQSNWINCKLWRTHLPHHSLTYHLQSCYRSPTIGSMCPLGWIVYGVPVINKCLWTYWYMHNFMASIFLSLRKSVYSFPSYHHSVSYDGLRVLCSFAFQSDTIWLYSLMRLFDWVWINQM